MQDVFVHESAYLDQGAQVGQGTKIWHFSHVMDGARIGKNCSFGQNTFVGGDVTIGDGCKFQNNVSIYDGVSIDDDVFCGPSCVFTNVTMPRAFTNQKHNFKVTRVEKGATIGANATIVCGITLGKYCFVAAGSTVTNDVKPFSMVMGSPARHKYWVSENGYKLEMDLTCPRTGQKYKIINGNLEHLE